MKKISTAAREQSRNFSQPKVSGEVYEPLHNRSRVTMSAAA
jgi:hypothetical protein